MPNGGQIAQRWAKDEAEALARRFFEQANAPSHGRCEDHVYVARALGYLLTGMSELLTQRRSVSLRLVATVVTISIPLGAIAGGITYGVGKLIGM